MLIAASEFAIASDPRSRAFGFIELINAAEALTKGGEAGLSLKLYELWQQHHPADPLRYAVCFNHGALLAGAGQQGLAAAAYAEAVMLAPGFLDDVRRKALLLKQRLAEIKDRHPAVIAEVRGEGLLIGLRAVVPAAELVDALRAEKMIAVSAGDNVVRLLPPLIIGEPEIAEGIARLDRACARLKPAPQAPVKEEAAR